MTERDELSYEVWLDTWMDSERERYAALPHNLSDPVALQRALDNTGDLPLERTAFKSGLKTIEPDEAEIRGLEFLEIHQEQWFEDFKDIVLTAEVREDRFDAFVSCMVDDWIDGRTRRQASPMMLAIKRSIYEYDLLTSPKTCGSYVHETLDPTIPAHFTPEEMAAIFEANYGLILAKLPDYIDHLEGKHLTSASSLNDLYIRRGVRMPSIEAARKELHYLSSYSLAMGPTEQFAQTWSMGKPESGIPSIFSAPISAVQDRVVAFAPFIKGMTLSQLELVVAPPLQETALTDCGMYGGITEFSFL